MWSYFDYLPWTSLLSFTFFYLALASTTGPASTSSATWQTVRYFFAPHTMVIYIYSIVSNYRQCITTIWGETLSCCSALACESKNNFTTRLPYGCSDAKFGGNAEFVNGRRKSTLAGNFICECAHDLQFQNHFLLISRAVYGWRFLIYSLC